jgi:isocitrate dehydrogenase (NAD+)
VKGKAADSMETAIASVIAEGKSLTYDLKPNGAGAAGTSQVADAVIEKMKEASHS